LICKSYLDRSIKTYPALLKILLKRVASIKFEDIKIRTLLFDKCKENIVNMIIV